MLEGWLAEEQLEIVTGKARRWLAFYTTKHEDVEGVNTRRIRLSIHSRTDHGPKASRCRVWMPSCVLPVLPPFTSHVQRAGVVHQARQSEEISSKRHIDPVTSTIEDTTFQKRNNSRATDVPRASEAACARAGLGLEDRNYTYIKLKRRKAWRYSMDCGPIQNRCHVRAGW